ncbi:MAG: ribonuclease III domain-containing protein [Eubacteriales bacterium]|nr:ribonuclease III domain-containing protein [Eubacteriales bacterium]
MSENNSIDPRTADTTKLAYIGDAVFELFIRKFVIRTSRRVSADKINREAIGYVRADSQALAAKALMDQGILTEEEERLFKRARNRTNTTRPRGTTPAHYKMATGFEALLGWLYLGGDTDRLDMIMEFSRKAIHEAPKAGSVKGEGERHE